MSSEQSSSKIGKSVGEKLRAARIAQNYTQSQLAAPDFSVSYISAIERGQIHPSLRALEILAARLGLSSTQLLPNRSSQADRQNSVADALEHEDEIELILLDVQLRIKQGSAEKALEQLDRIVVKRLKQQQQLQYRYLLGTAYLAVGRLQKSESTLLDAVQHVKDTNNHYLHRNMLNTLGQVYAAMHNYSQALLYHQRCLDLLTELELNDPLFEAQIYGYLGQHYVHLDNLQQAIKMFQCAIAIETRISDARAVRTIYLALSQQYINDKEFSLARVSTLKSAFLADQAAIKQLKSELYYYLGRVMLMSDKAKAYTYLNEAQRKESVKEDILSLASVYIHLAEWHLTNTTFEEAADCAQQANTLLEASGETIIKAFALITLGRIEYALQQYDEGDKHFVSGLAMLERLGNHEELAEQYVNYAQLLEVRGKEHVAFTYFRRAFQSRQRLSR